MNKKKIIIITLILSAIFGLSGTFMKIQHVSFADIFILIGGLIQCVFLYFLISFLIKAKE